MKKLFLVLCVMIMVFGFVGCPSSDNATSTNNNSGFASTAVVPVDGGTQPGGDSLNPVPEPATLLLLGSGLVSLAVVGRKRFKK